MSDFMLRQPLYIQSIGIWILAILSTASKVYKYFTEARNRKKNWGDVLASFAVTLIYINGFPPECEVVSEFDNGFANCSQSPYNTSVGTICNFKCNERYKLNGSSETVCTEKESWTPKLPNCDMITCPEMESSPFRKANCTDQNIVDSECRFSCEETHQIVGEEKALCQRDGTWSAELPACRLRKCGIPPNVEHGELKCSDENHAVGSLCSVECIQNHILQNKESNRVECLSNEKWSQPFQSCVCPHCAVGDNCEHSSSWQVFKNQISKYFGGFEASFGGHTMSCERDSSFYKWKHVWKCRCRDAKSGHTVRCDNYKSRFGACEHATAEMIRQMVGREVYPEPCDRATMATGC